MRPNLRTMQLLTPLRRARTLRSLKSLNLKVMTPTIPPSLTRKEEGMLTMTLAQIFPPPRLVPMAVVVAVAVVAAVAAITHPPFHLLYLLYPHQPMHAHQP